MSVLTYQPPASGFIKFMLLGMAVSATTLLATFIFVAFVLVPDDVRSAVFCGTSVQWRMVVNVTGI